MPVKQTLNLPFAPDEVTRDMVLVHFGSTKYDRDQFNQVTNSDVWCKPNGGLWCSVDGNTHSWDAWCKNNEYNISNLNTMFKLKFKQGSTYFNCMAGILVLCVVLAFVAFVIKKS